MNAVSWPLAGGLGAIFLALFVLVGRIRLAGPVWPGP